jgi:hypothetical protein
VKLACILLLVLSSTTAQACEPIIPFMQVVAGPGFLTQSLLVLMFVVLVKSLAFAKWQKNIGPFRAFVFMVIGNVLTTVIGFVAAAMIGSGSIWIIGAPIVFALCYLPAKRLVAAVPHPKLAGSNPAAIAALMTAGLFVSCFLFGFAQYELIETSLTAYWIGKVIAVYVALIVSIALTAFWEEWVVWRLSRCRTNEAGFAQPVIRANLLVLLLVMLVSAGFMLPKRLHARGFLVPTTEWKNGR